MATVGRALSRSFVVLLAAAMVVTFLPLEPVYAVGSSPETKAQELELSPTDAGGSSADAPIGPSEPATDPSEPAPADAEDEPVSEQGVPDDPRFSRVVEADFAFSMVGFRGRGTPQITFRHSLDGQVWSEWLTIEVVDEIDGPDPGSEEAAVAATALQEFDWTAEPHWLGEAQYLQVAALEGDLDEVSVTVIDSMGYSESILERASRQLRSLTTQAPAEATDGVGIVTRRQWGANESWRRSSPSYATVHHAVLHHTAGSNSYTREEAPGVVRGIYHWHTHGNGWNDIGYNFLVDRFGTIYEGRYGGVDRGVVGAHAAGWNTGSFGVSLMGNFDVARPPRVALDAAIAVMGWKYQVHGLDPSVSATLSRNGQTIRTLVGHRDVGQTACPGRYIHSQMDDIRARIQNQVAESFRGWTPVAGDWTGNGRDSVGWYRDGHWRLYPTLDAGVEPITFRYGTTGDLPLVGDWNGDGFDTVGIVRDGDWHLRNTLSGGPGQIVFRYGRVTQGDVPITGDWNGNGADTVGIIRDGDWHLRNTLSGGPGQIVFRYGRITRGDLPLIGDWNASGQQTVGIVRDGDWHLRNSLSAGAADLVFRYGRVLSGDVPLTGDWNGNGVTGVGIVRDGVFHLRNDQSPGRAQIEFVGM